MARFTYRCFVTKLHFSKTFQDLESAIVELYRKATTELPSDVLLGLSECLAREKRGSLADKTLKIILENVKIARETSRPICQDTGTPIFFVKYGPDFRQKELLEVIWRATERAGKEVPLRKNRIAAIGDETRIDSRSGAVAKDDLPVGNDSASDVAKAVGRVAESPFPSKMTARTMRLLRPDTSSSECLVSSFLKKRRTSLPALPPAYRPVGQAWRSVRARNDRDRSISTTPQNQPVCYFDERDEKGVKIGLILKGAGSENVSMTYSLPCKRLKAGRDLAGIRLCVLDSAVAAQGRGCPPMIASVVAGSPEDLVVVTAKRQLLRKIGSINADPELFSFETELTRDINELGIGPGGFGGKSTVMTTFVTLLSRHPASFFVHVCYFCWASRRGVMEFLDGKARFL